MAKRSLRNIKLILLHFVDLNIQMNNWVNINRLKGPINITKFVIDNLETPVYLNLSLPTKVKNVIVKADSDIGKINNINIRSFTENVLKVTDVIFLEHVTFGKSHLSYFFFNSK